MIAFFTIDRIQKNILKVVDNFDSYTTAFGNILNS